MSKRKGRRIRVTMREVRKGGREREKEGGYGEGKDREVRGRGRG